MISAATKVGVEKLVDDLAAEDVTAFITLAKNRAAQNIRLQKMKNSPLCGGGKSLL